MKSRDIVLLTALAGTLAGCSKKTARSCEEFDRAQKTLDEISDATLDPTFGDPKFERALKEFEAIPSDCAQHETAMTIAQTIRTAMAQRRSQPAEAAAIAPPPSPEAPAPVLQGDEAVKREIAEYFEKVKAAESGPDGTSGEAYFQKLIAEAFQKKGDFERVISEIGRVEGQLRAIDPPPACQELHSAVVGQTAEAKALFQQFQTAIANEDEAAVNAIVQRAPELDAAQARLKQMEQDIRRKYGL